MKLSDDDMFEVFMSGEEEDVPDRIEQAIYRAMQDHRPGQLCSLESTARELAHEVKRLQKENKELQQIVDEDILGDKIE